MDVQWVGVGTFTAVTPIRSLAWELRSLKLCNMAKKRNNDENVVIYCDKNKSVFSSEKKGYQIICIIRFPFHICINTCTCLRTWSLGTDLGLNSDCVTYHYVTLDKSLTSLKFVFLIAKMESWYFYLIMLNSICKALSTYVVFNKW